MQSRIVTAVALAALILAPAVAGAQSPAPMASPMAMKSPMAMNSMKKKKGLKKNNGVQNTTPGAPGYSGSAPLGTAVKSPKP